MPLGELVSRNGQESRETGQQGAEPRSGTGTLWIGRCHCHLLTATLLLLWMIFKLFLCLSVTQVYNFGKGEFDCLVWAKSISNLLGIRIEKIEAFWLPVWKWNYPFPYPKHGACYFPQTKLDNLLFLLKSFSKPRAPGNTPLPFCSLVL